MKSTRNLFRSVKSELSFIARRNPLIERPRRDYRNFIPEPYEGVVIVSADFELAWAWRYAINVKESVDLIIEKTRRERENIPIILDICENNGIPITWGTVGHLFLKSCTKEEHTKHSKIDRLPYFTNKYWEYSSGDWFDHDPCTNYKTSPEWYAPDLIDLIVKSSIMHEIACHSFSHISCEENICSPEVISSELRESQRAADQNGIKLETFIFPGHTMGNYDTIRDFAYSSIRTNFRNVLGYPVQLKNGLWEHKATMELRYNSDFTIRTNIQRYKSIVDKCIKNHQVCNLWFHPSFDEVSMRNITESVFQYLKLNKGKLLITTMKEYTRWLTINGSK